MSANSPATRSSTTRARSRSTPPKEISDSDSESGEADSSRCSDSVAELIDIEDEEPKAKAATKPKSATKPKTPSSARTVASASSSTRRKHPARTNAAGLPVVVQTKLAEDIEGAGGIELVKREKTFAKVINQPGREDFFGKSGSRGPGTRRSQVEEKWKHWKGLSDEECKEVLRSLRVWSAEELASQQQIGSASAQVTPAVASPLLKKQLFTDSSTKGKKKSKTDRPPTEITTFEDVTSPEAKPKPTMAELSFGALAKARELGMLLVALPTFF